MVAPAAIGALSLATTVAGGIFSAEGADEQAKATQASYNYQAGVADINAKIAKQNADFAMQAGEEEAARYGFGAAARMGQIRVAQGASGVDVNKGSPVDVRDSQKLVSDLDQYTIRTNAAKTAYGYTTQATSSTNQAQLLRMGGAAAATAGKFQVASSILGTTTSVADKWLAGQRTGLFPQTLGS